MRKGFLHFVLICLPFLGLFFLQSCNDNAIFDQNYSFEKQTWNKQDTVIFKVNVEDTLAVHDFILTLRIGKEYLYSNLWIYLFITAPDQTTSKVAEKLPIANPDGSWKGRVSGSLVENRIRFDSKKFPLKGDYVFKMVQATLEEQIPHIQDIGLRIE